MTDAAHHDFGDVVTGYPRPLQRAFHRYGAEFVGGHILQHTAEAANRRTGTVDDHDGFLSQLPFLPVDLRLTVAGDLQIA